MKMERHGFIKVAAAVPSLRVADCDYNSERIIELMKRAAERGVRVVTFPELSITAYSCGDLVRQSLLLKSAEQALKRIAEASGEINVVAIVGLPIAVADKIFNCAAVVAEGKVVGIVPKLAVPHSGVKTEARWFTSGGVVGQQMLAEYADGCVNFGVGQLFEVDGAVFGVEIGEDATLTTPPSVEMAERGAKIIFNPAATVELAGRDRKAKREIEAYSERIVAAYVHASAGAEESTTDMVYSGAAMIAESGRTLACGERFAMEEQLIVADIDVESLQNVRQRRSTFEADLYNKGFATRVITLAPASVEAVDRYVSPTPFIPEDEQEKVERCKEVFEIQTLGLMKRLRHTGCKCAVVGISGGLDSTLALLVAVNAFDRLGLDRKGVVGITMPGFGTTDRTYNNALQMMRELGVTMREIPIAAACRQHFADIGLKEDDRSVAYENAQARERTQILMDVANVMGGMVIGTGDLSELALGWATYNGDHMSMYGVNGSVPKTLIREIVTWYANAQGESAIATALKDVVATPVSPELLPADERGDIAQRTEDLVGPYELHDFFLFYLIHDSFSPSKILFLANLAFGKKYDQATIVHWLRTFCRRFFAQQFKRSALPDGVKVGSVSISPRGDWMMPSDAVATAWMRECDKLN